MTPRFTAGDPNADAAVVLVTVVASTAVWVAVTFLTQPEPERVLENFYRRVRPGGPGWARVSERLGLGREPIPGGALSWVNWLVGLVTVYSALFGIGRIVFGELVPGLLLLGIAALGFLWIGRALRQQHEPSPAEAVSAAAEAAD